jgi:hypothetical protein
MDHKMVEISIYEDVINSNEAGIRLGIRIRTSRVVTMAAYQGKMSYALLCHEPLT